MKIHLHETAGYALCGRAVPTIAQTVHIEAVTCLTCIRVAGRREGSAK